MSHDILISIITPTYNHEHFIAECIDSVRAQTYTKWEQIIIDDGSTDRTSDVIGRYEDARIRFVHQEHLGIEHLAHTYNRALQLCSGSVIAILEGDDAWPSYKLSHQIDAFDNDQIVLAFGEVQDIDESGRPAKKMSRTNRLRRKLPSRILSNTPPGTATRYLLTCEGQSFVAPSTALLRKSALEKIGGFQYVRGICPPDVPTFIKLSLLGSFSYCTEIVGYRRRHLTSSTLQFLRPMSTTPREFVFELLNDPSLALESEERKQIEKTWRTRSQTREFVAGRVCLLEKRWKEARTHFIRALHPRYPRAAAVAAVGWLISWVHRDLEAIFKVAGRIPLTAITHRSNPE